MQKEFENLTNDLVKYAKNFDPYEYRDVYNSDEDAYNDMKKNLSSVDGISTIIDWLSKDIHYFVSENDLSNKDIKDLSDTAYKLSCRLNQYSKLLAKENNKEDIDL